MTEVTQNTELKSDINGVATQMTFSEHLDELRYRLLLALAGLAIGMVLSLIFGAHIIHWLEMPYVQVMKEKGLDPLLVYNKASLGLTMYLQVSLYTGLVLSSPWIAYQLWMFVAAGLYAHERKYVVYAVPFSACLFVAGAGMFLFLISIPMLRFFIGFSEWLGLRSMVTVENHIEMMITMMIVFGLAFQTPIALLILAKMGLADSIKIKKYRPHIVVVLAIFAAVITPDPTFFSMLALGIPMYLLFEIGVLLVWWTKRQSLNRKQKGMHKAES